MAQLVGKRFVNVDQCADIKAFDSKSRDNLATDAETIAARNLLLHLIPQNQLLEMLIKLILVETLARALADGAEGLLTQAGNLTHQVGDILIVCQIAIVIGRRIKE